MRKLLILLAVVFAASLITTAGVDAAKCPTKYKARHHMVRKHKTSAMKCPMRHHRARPARYARGPIVNCPTPPAPIVNVPQQAAPVVNVPQGPAPVVNIPPNPPGVGITTDSTMIYIVRGNELMILDKCTYEVKKTVTLESSGMQ